jgi:hypothetical protein
MGYKSPNELWKGYNFNESMNILEIKKSCLIYQDIELQLDINDITKL